MPARSHILLTPVTASDAASGSGIRMHQRPGKGPLAGGERTGALAMLLLMGFYITI